MDLGDVRALIGPARFDAACVCALRTAAGTGAGGETARWDGDLAEVPHEIDDLWLDETEPAANRLELSFAVYRAMPCYWNTVGWTWLYPALDAVERDQLWEQVRARLSDLDDRLADPVGYGLWCDWFEDADTVGEAWAQVTAAPFDGPRLARVLAVSGPVPYPLKRPLLWSLADDPSWHLAIRGALDAAEHDAFGDLDRTDASRLRRGIDG